MDQRDRRVTLRDVAREANLSTAAVSYALRGLQVPAGTQRRVREIADRLGYQADPIARALVSGRTGTVGLLCGSLTDVWQQGMAAEIGRALLVHGRHALIVDASNDLELEAGLARQLVDQRVDALIVMSVDPGGEHWPAIARRTALVSFGDRIPAADTAAEVVFDNAGAVDAALAHLAERGHRRIAVLSPSSPRTPDRPADVAVAAAAARLGLELDLRLAPHDLRGAGEVARSVVQGAERPTAVFCLADSMAYGVYDACRESGLRIPEDVSVLGFDDHQLSRLLTPPMSSFRWPIADLVDTVVAATVAAIDDRHHTPARVFAPVVQNRGSVATR